MDYEKIIEALKLIKQICKDSRCDDCVFFDDECEIKAKDPCLWIINGEYDIWRALS